LKLIEKGLRENVPPEFLVEAEAREKAARLARPVTERLRKTIEREVLRLLEAGMSKEEILTQVTSKYGLQVRRRRTKES
jgi:hypothetical protein